MGGGIAGAGGIGGEIRAVTDEEILSAYRLLAREEGVFCEPASAASVAGLLAYASERSGGLSGLRAVCTITGHGLKDPEVASEFEADVVRVGASCGEVRSALEEAGS